MSELIFKNVYKNFDGGVQAVRDFCLKVEDKEFIAIAGPSGSGKTVTLRMVAGLEKPTRGEIIMDGRIINSVPPKDRRVSMVFQRYALFPHLNVYKNIAFGLKGRRMDKKEKDRRVRNAAEILNLAEVLFRKPNTLSGGQRQRVALGRAIVTEPKVFLLDEPLSNLDAQLRTEMRAQIIRAHDRVKSTFIYVTHDQTEAMTMADRIVVLNEGRIQQVDTPRDIYEFPANKFVASFIGVPCMNFFDCVTSKDGAFVSVSFGGGRLRVPCESLWRIPLSHTEGKNKMTLGIRPEDIALLPLSSKRHGLPQARVELVEDTGAELFVHAVLMHGGKDGASVTLKVKPNCTVNKGDIVFISAEGDRLYFFDSDTGESFKKRVPDMNVAEGLVEGDELVVYGTRQLLPRAITSQLGAVRGKAVISIPTDAVILGEGAGTARVVSREPTDRGDFLCLASGGMMFFAASEAGKDYPQEIAFRFDMKAVGIEKEMVSAEPLKINNFSDVMIVRGGKKKIRKKESAILYAGFEKDCAELTSALDEYTSRADARAAEFLLIAEKKKKLLGRKTERREKAMLEREISESTHLADGLRYDKEQARQKYERELAIRRKELYESLHGRKYRLLYEGGEIDLSSRVAQRMIDAYGKKTYKMHFSIEYSAAAASISDTGANGYIKNAFDYGNECFFGIKTEIGGSVIVPAISGYCIGDKVKITVNTEKAQIREKK